MAPWVPSGCANLLYIDCTFIETQIILNMTISCSDMFRLHVEVGIVDSNFEEIIKSYHYFFEHICSLTFEE